jgi:hypothetical protein
MANQIGVFKVIGDSNIRNAFSTRLKISERISGLSTEFVSAAAYSSGLLALSDLGEASIVLVSFLVNGLVDATELCSDFDAVDKVLESKVREYLAAIRMVTAVRPATMFYMLPPLTRTTPVWFESKMQNVTDIMKVQSEDISNLILLPSLVVLSRDLEADGIHLNRSTQARLFNHIMDGMFPGERSVKTRNISRDRPDSEDDTKSTPAKKQAERVMTATSSLTEWNGGACVGDVSKDSAVRTPSAAMSGTQDSAVVPNSDVVMQSEETKVICETVEREPEGESTELQNPELKQLYQMLSKKMDNVHNATTAVSSRVQTVELLAARTVNQVETNTLILKSLHLRTARQAEVLDSHSNTLNLNVVMISGVPTNLFRMQSEELPSTKSVIDKLIKFTPLLISAIKFATYAKYIKHQAGKLPNVKAFFINADSALAFRDAANKLRIAKTEFWSSVYVSNDPTKSTRIRICILQAIAKRLTPLPANEGKTIFVSRFDVRPQLCFKYAGRVERRLDFVAAVEKYRSVLTPEDREAAKKVAGKTFSEEDLRQFIVL